MVRRAAARLYDDIATIKNFTNSVIGDDGKVKQDEIIITSEPCRLSYKSVPVSGGDGVNTVQQTITLFIDKSIEIKAGSEIIINRNGKDLTFIASGAPALYQSHQEVPLKSKEVHNG